MPQPKVLKYRLEGMVLALRREGRSNQQVADELNRELTARGERDTLTKKAVERYLRTLDAASVPAAHQPTVAVENARLAVDVAANMNLLDGKLRDWLEEAEKAQVAALVHDGVVMGWAPDWHARVNVARELRRANETVVNLLERIHNASRIQAFQEEVLNVIRDTDPQTAQRIVAALRERQDAERAIGLGG